MVDNVLISQIPAALALSDADLFEVEQGVDPDNTSGKVTLGAIKAYVQPPAVAMPYDLIVALGDETTAITTGVAKVTFRAPRAFTLSAVKSSLTTASSSGIPTFNVKKNGVTIFSTKSTVDVTELTSVSAAVPSVLSVTSFAADDVITIDVDVAGTGATGAKLTFIGTLA